MRWGWWVAGAVLALVLAAPLECSSACSSGAGGCSTSCRTVLGYPAPLGDAGWLLPAGVLALAGLRWAKDLDRR